MWCLPSIQRLNAEASRNRRRIERAVHTGKYNGKVVRCDYESDECYGEVFVEPWYDIFSDDPKGIIAQCEYHRDHLGTPEGFFCCEGCQRTMTENYTWELYVHHSESGPLCLPCYARKVISDDDRWIQLSDENIDSLTFKQVRKAPHCIGVRMPIPNEIRFVNNVEFDALDGHCISGGGVDELKETLRDLKSEGVSRALLVLDAAYQFAVSIGVYAAKRDAE